MSSKDWEEYLRRKGKMEYEFPRVSKPWERDTYIEEIEGLILGKLSQTAQTFRKPTYTKTVLPRIEEYLITFIGGPFNATQRIEKVSTWPTIADGAVIKFPAEPGPVSFIKDQASRMTPESFAYKTVLIPQNETRFTDAQCVVAVFVS